MFYKEVLKKRREDVISVRVYSTDTLPANSHPKRNDLYFDLSRGRVPRFTGTSPTLRGVKRIT